MIYNAQTRDAHLADAKARALAELDQGSIPNAIASLWFDLAKHCVFEAAKIVTTAQAGFVAAREGPDSVRAWINQIV